MSWCNDFSCLSWWSVSRCGGSAFDPDALWCWAASSLDGVLKLIAFWAITISELEASALVALAIELFATLVDSP